jgi:Bax protein
MTRTFERGALFSIFALVTSLLTTALVYPPNGETAAPKGVVILPAPSNDVVRSAEPKFIPVKARGSETLLQGKNIGASDAGHVIQSRNPAAVLDRTFTQMGYDLETVAAGQAEVPRVFLASMPADIEKMRETKKRKGLFFKTVLPLVLQVNEEITGDRKRLADLIKIDDRGAKIGPVDRLWLIVMAERYKTKRGDLKSLMQRVDVIPPSLALAQAAEESGWGSSRFVKEGNAMFGQWTWSKTASGIVPKKRDEGRSHRIKVFDSLLHSVRAYARNLNTHRAYRHLRSQRSKLRSGMVPVDGLALAKQLKNYSERGEDYIKTLSSIIHVNKLRRFDAAKLIKNLGDKPSI